VWPKGSICTTRQMIQLCAKGWNFFLRRSRQLPNFRYRSTQNFQKRFCQVLTRRLLFRHVRLSCLCFHALQFVCWLLFLSTMCLDWTSISENIRKPTSWQTVVLFILPAERSTAVCSFPARRRPFPSQYKIINFVCQVYVAVWVWHRAYCVPCCNGRVLLKVRT
jgi:hypothetical protein